MPVSRHLYSAKPSVRAHKGAYNHFISSDKPALIGFDPFIQKFKCQWAKLSHTRIQVSGNVIQVILLRLNRPAPIGNSTGEPTSLIDMETADSSRLDFPRDVLFYL